MKLTVYSFFITCFLKFDVIFIMYYSMNIISNGIIRINETTTKLVLGHHTVVTSPFTGLL